MLRHLLILWLEELLQTRLGQVPQLAYCPQQPMQIQYLFQGGDVGKQDFRSEKMLLASLASVRHFAKLGDIQLMVEELL